jgi:NADH-quinone oxidoreductase subunit F
MTDFNEIDKIVEDSGREKIHLIPILQKIQAKYNYLPEDALHRISEITDITPSEVISAASFYPQFRMKPAGKYFIQVCVGTACHVKGASGITEAFRQHLDIEECLDTDSDQLFTVEEVACLGCCMLAPAVRIGDLIYGYLEPAKVPEVLADFLQEQAAESDCYELKSDNSSAGEVRLCLCSSCLAAGSGKVEKAIKECVTKFKLPITLKRVSCTGLSFEAPLLDIVLRTGASFRYGTVHPEGVRAILMRHFKPSSKGAVLHSKIFTLLEKLLVNSPEHPAVTRYSPDIRADENAYCSCQKRIVTEHSGELSPLNIDEYILSGGFKTLELISEKDGDSIIDEIKASGLRGRGGGGFPTWKKWKEVKDALPKEDNNSGKVLICNGDEGDPGAFMDRMILESFPFRVIEGMIIAAAAVGATEGIFYIRSEYPLALRNIRKAIAICEERGRRSSGVLECLSAGVERVSNEEVGTQISKLANFTLRVIEGAGAFVCGEESALIASLEGGRGNPSRRPPYPSESGFTGRPTLINNVETFASVPWIISNGSANFAEIGTGKSRGTKAFALAGKIKRGGLIEVPMGMSVNEIIFDIGGGIPNNKKVKAVQVGGPSGGCIPAELFDTPIDYEQLLDTGAIMGSGGLIVLDEDDCMVDIAKYFISFVQRESCGKCTFCRIGTRRMLEILNALCTGKAKKGDIERLIDLSEEVKKGSLCGLGKTAPNPVLSSIKYFREEFEAHIDGKCPAGKCKDLIRYFISTDCIGCTICAQNCPVDAIKTVPHQRHEIDKDKCVKCGVCQAGCPVGAVKK